MLERSISMHSWSAIVEKMLYATSQPCRLMLVCIGANSRLSEPVKPFEGKVSTVNFKRPSNKLRQSCDRLRHLAGRTQAVASLDASARQRT